MPFTALPIPFGGYKQSGFGRELGIDTLELYLETKSVIVSTSPKPFNPSASKRGSDTMSLVPPGCAGRASGASSVVPVSHRYGDSLRPCLAPPIARPTKRIMSEPLTLRYRWAVLAAGTAAAAAGSALFIGPAVLAPAIREEFDASLSQVGVLLASLWVGTILTLLGWGLLADRLGERVVLGTGLGICGLFATAAGWAGDFWALLGLLFLAGAAGASA